MEDTSSHKTAADFCGFGLAALPFLALHALFNLSYGHVLGPYHYHASGWTGFLPVNLISHLISPSRGLLVFSPVLVLCAAGIKRKIFQERDPLFIMLGAACLGQLLLISLWGNWWGGWSYGPRLTSDMLPLLVLFLPPLLDQVRESGSYRKLGQFLFLAVLSAGIHAGNVYSDRPRMWNANPEINWYPSRLWEFRDSQIASLLIDRPLFIPFDTVEMGKGQALSSPSARFRRCKFIPAGEPVTVSHSLVLAPGEYRVRLRVIAPEFRPRSRPGQFTARSSDGKLVMKIGLSSLEPQKQDVWLLTSDLKIDERIAKAPVEFQFVSSGAAPVCLDHFSVRGID